jgi:hypothetical protein
MNSKISISLDKLFRKIQNKHKYFKEMKTFIILELVFDLDKWEY